MGGSPQYQLFLKHLTGNYALTVQNSPQTLFFTLVLAFHFTNCILQAGLQCLVRTGTVGPGPSLLPCVSSIFLLSNPLALALTTVPLLARQFHKDEECIAEPPSLFLLVRSKDDCIFFGKVFTFKSGLAAHFLASFTRTPTPLRYVSLQPLIVLSFRMSAENHLDIF